MLYNVKYSVKNTRKFKEIKTVNHGGGYKKLIKMFKIPKTHRKIDG